MPTPLLVRGLTALAVLSATFACGPTADPGGADGGGPTVGIAAQVSGLAGGLSLAINGGSPLVIVQDGRHDFPERLPEGAAYIVSVLTQPQDQRCTLENAVGTASTDLTVSVLCEDLSSGFSVGGVIQGVSGEVVLQNNGKDDLVVNADGAFKFSTRLEDGDDFAVTVKVHPDRRDCAVTDGSGKIEGANVTGIKVTCSDLVYRLTNRGVSTEAPSVVKAVFHVNRAADGTPVPDLRPEHFRVLEDGAPIDEREAFMDVVEAGEIPFTLRTALMLDVSSSLSAADVERVKQTARAVIADPETGASRLLPGQQFAIYTFDDRVIARRDFTADVASLLSAIDGVTRGGPSTNLYGAIQTGLNRVTDAFSLDHVSKGAVIVITDGNDTAGLVEKEDVIAARGDKLLFAIPVGSEVTVSHLEEIAGAANVLPATDFTQLQAALQQAVQRIATLADGKGLYILYYATPKRAGTHTITVSMPENTSTGSAAQVTGEFDASGFSNVYPTVVKRGPELVRDGETIRWELRTRWTLETPSFTWTVQDPYKLLQVVEEGPTADGKGIVLAISPTGAGYGNASVQVEDSGATISGNFQVAVKTALTPRLQAWGAPSKVILRWSAVSDATAYRLYWSAGGTETAIPVYGGQLSYVHPGVTDGTAYSYRLAAVVDGEEHSSPAVTATPGTPAVTQISAGTSFSCALTDGLVRCWGQNNSGMLGTGTTSYSQLTPGGVLGLDGVTQLATGDSHACALRTDGTVWCWGANSYGQVGTPSSNTLTRPIRVEGLSGAVKIAAGGGHSCAVLADQTARCWGQNSSGQLGDGTTENRASPVQVLGLSGVTQVSGGGTHTCAVVTGGGVKCWGANSNGQLGDGATVQRLTPVSVSGLSGATAVTAGDFHSCALLGGGALRCWGQNWSGQLGDGSTTQRLTPVAVSGVGAATQVSAGRQRSCAVLTTGATWCWPGFGCGSSCNPTSYYGPAAVYGVTGSSQVSMGEDHACVRAGGGLRCWGSNSYGQLGTGGTSTASTPVPVAW